MDWYYAVAKGQKASQGFICSGYRPSLHPMADWVYLQTGAVPASELVEVARI